MILYPINHKQWNRVSADEFERGEVSDDQVCVFYLVATLQSDES